MESQGTGGYLRRFSLESGGNPGTALASITTEYFTATPPTGRQTYLDGLIWIIQMLLPKLRSKYEWRYRNRSLLKFGDQGYCSRSRFARLPMVTLNFTTVPGWFCWGAAGFIHGCATIRLDVIESVQMVRAVREVLISAISAFQSTTVWLLVPRIASL